MEPPAAVIGGRASAAVRGASSHRGAMPRPESSRPGGIGRGHSRVSPRPGWNGVVSPLRR